VVRVAFIAKPAATPVPPIPGDEHDAHAAHAAIDEDERTQERRMRAAGDSEAANALRADARARSWMASDD